MSSALFVLLIAILLIAAVLILFWHPQRSRTRTDILADRRFTGDVYRDDDRYWQGIFFYNNPDDPALFVPKRYGLGWTVNIGHPLGKPLVIVMLLLPLVMLILTVLISGTAPIGCHPSGCHFLP